jgi:FtsP/CotA-like multicopper oxidase with cupredoxin domain/plastocyanin
MATVEYWIQIENHAWDAAPANLDRMTGQTIEAITGTAPVSKMLLSPETGVSRMRTMFMPLSEDALILRRYTANWAAPDDRKVNPWDANERDPGENGTMGTIPGPVLECNVGDTVVVHFRNRDHRTDKPDDSRVHSLHPHGFAFANSSDGAYPLSPPDPAQPIPAGSQAAWAAVGANALKRGDRVPPDEDFTYTWTTIGWPTTAGVWLYHDHSICDMENVELGAIGAIVIHNPNDPDDVIDPPLPGGSAVGSPIMRHCFPFPGQLEVLPHQLAHLEVPALPHGGGGHEAGSDDPTVAHEEPVPGRTLVHGDLTFQVDKAFKRLTHFCLPVYRTPPDSAQYILLFHNLLGATMCINGRKFLGNTPTLIAGRQTKMRFGLIGMGNVDGFHTFHLHGHRWVIPGPDGADPNTIENSPQVTAVSQFEDTRTFGPANSFSFTINPGSFMRSEPPLGEWHMHCHVLSHMMDGMMGSLLKINGGELAFGLPVGRPCPTGGGPGGLTVAVKDFAFAPKNLMVMPGDTVTWEWAGADHSTTSDTGVWDSGVHDPPHSFSHTFTAADAGQSFPYFCSVHGGPGGAGMAGTVHVM